MKKLIIDRNNWNRGSNPQFFGDVRLLNGQRNLCCLGFLGRACKIKDEYLLNVLGPVRDNSLENYYDTGSVIYKNHINFPKTDYNPFMEVNDSKDLTDNERELKLKKLFQSIDYDVEFTN